MSVEFPIYVLAKDCGEVRSFDSVYELQKQLEEIDVENAEYLAWDKSGTPISLAVQKPVWLKLEYAMGAQQPDLKSCLEKYASAVGVDVDFKGTSAQEFKRAYEQIEARVKRSTRPNILGRLMGRR